MMKKYSLPVIVYHHVNNSGEDITEPQFSAQMRYLAENGYRSVFLKAWMDGNCIPDGKTVGISFDDGYADNWIYAFPILKQYGHKATIFHTTARSREDLKTRPNLEDVWSGKISRDQLPSNKSDWEANRECVRSLSGSDAYMTWPEMREMESTGIIDIQSHTHFHRDFYVSEDIVDFNRNIYFGVGWATDGDTRFGIPLYPRKSAMMARRYFDDSGLRNYMAETVGSPEFFSGKNQSQYMRQLMVYVEKYRRNKPVLGHFESEDAQRKRILEELALSKALIEKHLEKTCSVICWPWGEYSELSLSMARQAGYLGAVSFRPGANLQGTAEARWHLKRFPPPKNLRRFARDVSDYSSPVRAKQRGYVEAARSLTLKISRRIQRGQLVESIKRNISSGRSV